MSTVLREKTQHCLWGEFVYCFKVMMLHPRAPRYLKPPASEKSGMCIENYYEGKEKNRTVPLI